MSNFAFCSAFFTIFSRAAAMMLRRALGAGSIATALVFAVFGTSALGQSNPGDFVLDYAPDTGNMTLVFTGTGAAGAGPVSIQSLDIITLGNADAGHPLMPAGIPGVTAGQGGLNAAVATLPPVQFVTLNDNPLGMNGIYSQIFAANIGTTWRTFDLSDPGVSDRLDLGNVAPAGWNLADLSTIFMTDPNVYGSYNYGNFGYAEGNGTPLFGAVVPEPSSVATLGLSGLAGLAFRRRRSR